MLKIKVSYENKDELDYLIYLLGLSNIKLLKLANNQVGQFKKAYITMKEVK